MECIHLDKPCPYRKKSKAGDIFCGWSCGRDGPGEKCEVAEAGWSCPWVCIYEALEPQNSCPHKDELKKSLEMAKHIIKGIVSSGVIHGEGGASQLCYEWLYELLEKVEDGTFVTITVEVGGKE